METKAEPIQDSLPEFVKKAPATYRTIWEHKLTEGQRKILCEQAANYQLENTQQIERFWLSRNMDKIMHEAKSLDLIMSSSVNKPKINLSESKTEDPLVSVMRKLQ